MDINQIKAEHAAKMASIFERMNEGDARYQKRWDEYQLFCQEPGGKAPNTDLIDPSSPASKKLEAEKIKKAEKKGWFGL